MIGKAGATVNKIKEDTKTRIDIPAANDPSDVITVTGVRAMCEEARKRMFSRPIHPCHLAVSLGVLHFSLQNLVDTAARLLIL